MDKIFADGLFFQEPAPTAPEFVKGNLSVNTKKFTEFLSKQTDERGWVNLSIKKSKTGTCYVELNTWKPQKQETQDIPVVEEKTEQLSGPEEIQVKDIPF